MANLCTLFVLHLAKLEIGCLQALLGISKLSFVRSKLLNRGIILQLVSVNLSKICLLESGVKMLHPYYCIDRLSI